jgi:hypothetical protein
VGRMTAAAPPRTRRNIAGTDPGVMRSTRTISSLAPHNGFVNERLIAHGPLPRDSRQPARTSRLRTVQDDASQEERAAKIDRPHQTRRLKKQGNVPEETQSLQHAASHNKRIGPCTLQAFTH